MAKLIFSFSEGNLDPSFASWSAISLPLIPECPGIQCNETVAFLSAIIFAALIALNWQDCPG